MKVKVDFKELTEEGNRASKLKERASEDAWDILRMHAFELERRIKANPPQGMPVDTGRAKGSWGHSVAPATAGDGIWIEDKPGLTITEGSNVEYIAALNEGHSRQSPAGFIDLQAEVVTALLEQALSEFMETMK